ncbi:MAG TPA: M3 family metallopeptidase, partial [Pseudomonadales bacterium]
MSNAILTMTGLPSFKNIKPEHVEEAIALTLNDNREKLNKLLQQKKYTWENLIAPLAEMEDRLSQRWSPVSHLNAVMNNEKLRTAYNKCLPKLSEYATEMGQHKALFAAYRSIAESEAYKEFNTSQQQMITNALRDFRLSGIDLEEANRQRFGEIKKRLSELTSKYSENVLDATQAWEKHISNSAELAGLPQSALDSAQQLAQQKDKPGFIINLEFPSYLPVMTYCENRKLREELHKVFVTRASAISPSGSNWDNSVIMLEILGLRYELAQLLGFKNYAELSLATKMADNTQAVFNFLNELAARSQPFAQQEYKELNLFAKKIDQLEVLEAWDVAYYSEKLRQQKYDISQEELRPYFPVSTVLDGLFEIAKRLYGIAITANQNMETWHNDVQCFDISDKTGETIARFYIDLYARENKRGGAWMDECKVRRRDNKGNIQLPVAYLVCNFTSPVGDKPALLSHNEVTTLFHEFGHGLHHMLTQVDVAAVSGINGVP